MSRFIRLYVSQAQREAWEQALGEQVEREVLLALIGEYCHQHGIDFPPANTWGGKRDRTRTGYLKANDYTDSPDPDNDPWDELGIMAPPRLPDDE